MKNSKKLKNVKKNKRGFTLVELLAVIIILAIVVGISIPAVLTTTSKAKKSAFKSAAEAGAKWFDEQYSVAKSGYSGLGVATLDTTFKSFCGSSGSTCRTDTGVALNEEIIAAAGLKPSNFNLDATDGNKVYISASGRTCLKLTAKNADYPSGKVECGGVCTATQCTSTNNG